MKILTITQKVDKNDAILGFYVEWIRGMARRADHVQVIALQAGEYDLPDNVEVISLNKKENSGALSMLSRFSNELWRLCRTKKPDVILAHMVPKYVLYAYPIAALFFIPIDLWYTHKGVDFNLRLANLLVRNAFTASEESFRLNSKKKVVTGHGVDTDFFHPGCDNNREGIITVGRIAPSKDQETLISAIAMLRDRYPAKDLHVSIIGEPLLQRDREYRDQIEEQVRKNSLDEIVSFIGALPHNKLAPNYRSASIMVNASHTGSVDKVVLEAMASGAIPLTCNESFIPLFSDMAGQLVFNKKDPADLAKKIEYLLKMDKTEKADLVQKLRKIVEEEHNLNSLMDKIISKMISS